MERRRVCEGLLEAVGRTPMVRLSRLFPPHDFQVIAKLEGCNPGGSIKDRAAVSILKGARERGEIDAQTVVIESSSGNMGIGLASACRYLGLRLICVVDPKITATNAAILEAYGAEVDRVVLPDPETGEYLQARLKRVAQLRRQIPNSYWPDQYSNLDNPRAHQQTMEEVLADLGGPPDFLFVAASTCGTVRGCAEYIEAHGLATQLVGVDAVGSVIFGGERGKRLIPGHGAAVRPPLFRDGMVTRTIHVTDADCIRGCHQLLAREGILAGGSSGAILAAIAQHATAIPQGSTCVAVLCDRGERYLDTIYSRRWVSEHFGTLVEELATWGERPQAPAQSSPGAEPGGEVQREGWRGSRLDLPADRW